MTVPLSATPFERDVVIVSGSDAAGHLQTQLTQDVVGLETGRSTWSFFLTPKSVIASMVRVTKTQDGGVLLDVHAGGGGPLRASLDRFLSRMDVEFAEERWSGYAWRGTGAFDVTSAAPIVAPYPWTTSEALDVVGPDLSPPAGVDSLSEDELEHQRILAGWPAMGAEIDGEATPAMTGIVEHTVSFTKGCYTGQEFVARIHYRDAKPPKHLVQIEFQPGSAVTAGLDITIDGASVGRVTSALPAVGLGLGYAKRSVVTPTDAIVGLTVVSVR